MDTLNAATINDLLAGKTSIKVGVDLQDVLILSAAVFASAVLAGVAIKLLTRNL